MPPLNIYMYNVCTCTHSTEELRDYIMLHNQMQASAVIDQQSLTTTHTIAEVEGGVQSESSVLYAPYLLLIQ